MPIFVHLVKLNSDIIIIPYVRVLLCGKVNFGMCVFFFVVARSLPAQVSRGARHDGSLVSSNACE